MPLTTSTKFGDKSCETIIIYTKYFKLSTIFFSWEPSQNCQFSLKNRINRSYKAADTLSSHLFAGGWKSFYLAMHTFPRNSGKSKSISSSRNITNVPGTHSAALNWWSRRGHHCLVCVYLPTVCNWFVWEINWCLPTVQWLSVIDYLPTTISKYLIKNFFLVSKISRKDQTEKIQPKYIFKLSTYRYTELNVSLSHYALRSE